jgi:hypothetical protein
VLGKVTLAYFEKARRREYGDGKINEKKLHDLDAKLGKRLRQIRDEEIAQDGISVIPTDYWGARSYQAYHAHLREMGILPAPRG